MARILIVEDHPANLKLARVILEREGHEVIGIDNATDGVLLAAECRPHLILMDIQLPGLDGFEATRMLKRQELTAHIPVVALTAFAMPDDPARMHAAGCDGYLAKPFRRASLLKTVARALAYD